MRSTFPSVCLITVLVLGLACSDDAKDPVGPDVPGPFPTTGPANVLASFARSLARMDIAAFEPTLAETFEFRSTEPGYESLSKAETVPIVTSIFAEVLGIQIRLDNSGAVPSSLNEFPATDGHMMITVPATRLEIATTRDEGQGPITYLIDGDLSVFVFKETSPDVWQVVMLEADGPWRTLLPQPSRVRHGRRSWAPS